MSMVHLEAIRPLQPALSLTPTPSPSTSYLLPSLSPSQPSPSQIHLRVSVVPLAPMAPGDGPKAQGFTQAWSASAA
jgi:hypothetical protein